MTHSYATRYSNIMPQYADIEINMPYNTGHLRRILIVQHQCNIPQEYLFPGTPFSQTTFPSHYDLFIFVAGQARSSSCRK